MIYVLLAVLAVLSLYLIVLIWAEFLAKNILSENYEEYKSIFKGYRICFEKSGFAHCMFVRKDVSFKLSNIRTIHLIENLELKGIESYDVLEAKAKRKYRLLGWINNFIKRLFKI